MAEKLEEHDGTVLVGDDAGNTIGLAEEEAARAVLRRDGRQCVPQRERGMNTLFEQQQEALPGEPGLPCEQADSDGGRGAVRARAERETAAVDDGHETPGRGHGRRRGCLDLRAIDPQMTGTQTIRRTAGDAHGLVRLDVYRVRFHPIIVAQGGWRRRAAVQATLVTDGRGLTAAANRRAPIPLDLSTDVLILGAGAAGMMCAAEAGRRGRRVLLLDHAPRAGRKILISGGGRANFTNLHCTPENFLSENVHFARSALARYTPADFVALVEDHRIPYHEKTIGQLFCDGSAQAIVSMLEAECAKASVGMLLSTRVISVTRESCFRIETTAGTVRADRLVVATGGPSIPKVGATGFGYELAAQFGLRLVEPRPALVPFVLAEPDQERWCDLSGISTEVTLRVDETPSTRRSRDWCMLGCLCCCALRS